MPEEPVFVDTLFISCDPGDLPPPATKLIVTQLFENPPDSSRWAWIIVGVFYDIQNRPLWSTELFLARWDPEPESDEEQASEAGPEAGSERGPETGAVRSDAVESRTEVRVEVEARAEAGAEAEARAESEADTDSLTEPSSADSEYRSFPQLHPLRFEGFRGPFDPDIADGSGFAILPNVHPCPAYGPNLTHPGNHHGNHPPYPHYHRDHQLHYQLPSNFSGPVAGQWVANFDPILGRWLHGFVPFH